MTVAVSAERSWKITTSVKLNEDLDVPNVAVPVPPSEVVSTTLYSDTQNCPSCPTIFGGVVAHPASRDENTPVEKV